MVAPNEIETYSAKVRITFNQPNSEVQSIVADLLQRIGAGCVAAGASLIGHIKCYGETPDGQYLNCSLTSLRSGASCRGNIVTPNQEIALDINVLVYGLGHEVIGTTVNDSLKGLSEENGMAFEFGSNEAHSHHEH